MARFLVDKQITVRAEFDAVAIWLFYYLYCVIEETSTFKLNTYYFSSLSAIYLLKCTYLLLSLLILLFEFKIGRERKQAEKQRKHRAANEASIYGCMPNGLYVTRVGLGKCRNHCCSAEPFVRLTVTISGTIISSMASNQSIHICLYLPILVDYK